jgi:hypothetical protein
MDIWNALFSKSTWSSIILPRRQDRIHFMDRNMAAWLGANEGSCPQRTLTECATPAVSQKSRPEGCSILPVLAVGVRPQAGRWEPPFGGRLRAVRQRPAGQVHFALPGIVELDPIGAAALGVIDGSRRPAAIIRQKFVDEHLGVSRPEEERQQGRDLNVFYSYIASRVRNLNVVCDL